jgi:hypothetical protein
MRSIRSALAAAFLVLMLVVPAASADSVTVNGSGDIDKMSVNNGKKALTVKLYGFDPPCEAHYFKIVVFWGGKPAYQASGGCYPGAQWITSLEYFSNRNAQDSKPVRCPKFRLAYKAGPGLAAIRPGRVGCPRLDPSGAHAGEWRPSLD